MTEYRGDPIDLDGSNNGALPKGRRLGSLVGRAGSGTHRTGVLVDDMSPIVSGSGSMSYNVRAGAFVTKMSDANGPVVSASDATKAVATTAAPGSNSRIDSVYAIQDLVTADGGSTSTNEFRFGVVQGSTSATPSAPAIPTGAIRLANVTVTSGATATSGLTFDHSVCQWTVANGGLIPAAKGSRQFLAWNGTEFLNLYASTAPTNHQVSIVTDPVNLWSSQLYVTQQATAFGMQMTIRGRLTRETGAFTVPNDWTLDVGSITLPTALRPNLGPTDLNLFALHNGYRNFAFLLRSDGRVFLRSTTPFSFGGTDFIDIPGQSWTRTG